MVNDLALHTAVAGLLTPFAAKGGSNMMEQLMFPDGDRKLSYCVGSACAVAAGRMVAAAVAVARSAIRRVFIV